jgi:hypothetical protein
MLDFPTSLDESLFWAGLEKECPFLHKEIHARNIKRKMPLMQALNNVCDANGLERINRLDPVIVSINRIEMDLRKIRA